MVEKFEVMITPFQCMRTIHVYLPDNYNESQEQYPVIYMFDGHNLFFDEDATYGKSWGLKDFLDNYDKKLIIVGIECNHEGHERLNEFSPYTYKNSFFGFIEGKGQQLMDWVIQELKPIVDKKYRTYPFRECSAVGGSSMGGLMALYTVIKYNQYFSKAACLSSAISMCFLQLQEDLKNSWIDSDTKVLELMKLQILLKHMQCINFFMISLLIEVQAVISMLYKMVTIMKLHGKKKIRYI